MNTNTDESNCGACGNVCSGVLCSQGQCDAIASPADLSGLALWFDAADASTISLSGGGVKLWHDKGPNGLDVAQGHFSAMPSYTQNVVIFNGSNYLTRGSYASLPLGGADRTGFYVVVNYNGTGLRKSVFYGGTQKDTGFGFSTLTDGGPYLSIINDGVMTGATWPSGLIVATGEATSSTVTLYLDGLDAGARAVPTMATSSAGALTIGALSDGSQLWMGGVAEHILYSRALTPEERAEVENYLAKKWNVTVTHP